MHMIDISWPISGTMTTYKDRNDVLILSPDSNQRDSKLFCGIHTGTHVDAPAHFIEKGKTVDQISVESLCGAVLVIDCSEIHDCITKDDLIQYKDEIGLHKKVLLKTKNSLHPPTDPFDFNFVYLHLTGAEFLVEAGVTVVGIDYLGIERNQPGHPTHKTILKVGIIVEGLRLAHVDAGMYELICFPLHMIGTDGALARVFLKK